MTRVDYYNDPNAPKANSIVVAVTAFVQEKSGYVLMIWRTDNNLWALPGGVQDIGDTVAETVVREVREETGIDVRITGLIGVYSDPCHVIAYDNGEVRQEFSICFRARPIGGQPRPSSDARAVHWINPEELERLDIHPVTRLRIQHGLKRRRSPHIG